MFPIYGIDMLNLYVPSIWNDKISYVQMVIIYQCLPPPSKCEKNMGEVPNRVSRPYGEYMVKYSVKKTSLFLTYFNDLKFR